MIKEEVYKSLLDRIIENEQSFYGESAIDIFRKVKGISISDNGKVLTMSGDFKNIIQDIIAEFKKLDGFFSLGLMNGIIKAYRSSYPDIDFPV